MPKIRVGVITYDFFPFLGGMGRGIYEIYCRRLIDDPELEFFFFSPCENEIPNHTKVARFSRKIGLNLVFSVVTNININKWVTAKKLNLISFHGGTGGVFLARELDIPIIYTCHGTLYRQYKSSPIQRWKWVLSKLEQRSYEQAEVIRAVSKDVRNIIVSKYGINAEKVKVIYNGVNSDEFKKIEEVNKIQNSLIFVGRLEPRKGISSLVREVIPLIKKDIPDVKLFIAGSGSLQNELKALVKSLGLEPNITFLGWVSGQELVKWYNQACIAVIPPIFEPFGQTTTEAMSCGTPIIATRVPAISEIIENGENGLLVEYGDIKALSEAIIGLLGDDAMQRKFSIAGRKDVEHKFNWDTVAKEMKKIILTTMDGHA